MTTFPALYNSKKKKPQQAVNGFLPKTVIVPLEQEYDCTCSCVVEKGQVVKEGETIAVPLDRDGGLHAEIHSPVPGRIEDIFQSPSPDGKEERAVKIRIAGSFSYLGKKRTVQNWHVLSPDDIRNDFARKGVINTFIISKPVSLAASVGKAQQKKDRLLIVRLFDEEPSRTTDSLIYHTFEKEVITGSWITAYALGAAGIVFLYDSRSTAPDLSEGQKENTIPSVSLAVSTKKYPNGFFLELCETVKRSFKGEPYSNADLTDLYVDTSTMYSAYRAIACDEPVISRCLTVSGDCIPAVGLFNVCIGTTVRSLAEQCGGFTTPPAAIIINGLITGNATSDLDTPVTSYVKSVMLLSSGKVYDERQSVCIGCGICRKVCPRSLAPDILYRHATGGKAADPDYISSAQLCTACGMCSSVCPARLPLIQTINTLKETKA